MDSLSTLLKFWPLILRSPVHECSPLSTWALTCLAKPYSSQWHHIIPLGKPCVASFSISYCSNTLFVNTVLNKFGPWYFILSSLHMQTSYSPCLDFVCLSKALTSCPRDYPKLVLFIMIGLRHSALGNLDSPPSSTHADVCLALSPIMILRMNYLERKEKGKESKWREGGN